MVGASFSSADALWTIEAERGEARERVRFTCSFLFGCTGYYDYANGYTPDFADVEKFAGLVVHPQHWPESLDYAGKRVVVIGSGLAHSHSALMQERAPVSGYLSLRSGYGLIHRMPSGRR